jgi:hypothetical protein
MKDPEDDRLAKALDQWEAPEGQTGLAQEVWRDRTSSTSEAYSRPVTLTSDG